MECSRRERVLEMIWLPWDLFLPLHRRGSWNTPGILLQEFGQSYTVSRGFGQSHTVSRADPKLHYLCFWFLWLQAWPWRDWGSQEMWISTNTPFVLSAERGAQTAQQRAGFHWLWVTFTFRELQRFQTTSTNSITSQHSQFSDNCSTSSSTSAFVTGCFLRALFSLCSSLHGANFHLTQSGPLHWCITSAVNCFARNYVTF